MNILMFLPLLKTEFELRQTSDDLLVQKNAVLQGFWTRSKWRADAIPANKKVEGRDVLKGADASRKGRPKFTYTKPVNK